MDFLNASEISWGGVHQLEPQWVCRVCQEEHSLFSDHGDSAVAALGSPH